MRAFIDYAFDYLRVNRNEVCVAIGNIRIPTIPKILVFNDEGRLLDAEWRKIKASTEDKITI